MTAALCITLCCPTWASAQAANGEPYFDSPFLSYDLANDPTSMTSGDFNEDGNIDFAVGSLASNSISVVFGSDTGALSMGPDIPWPDSPLGLASSDLNRDGHADLVVASSHGVTVLAGRGDGTFQALPGFTSYSRTYAPVVADLNADGWPDVVVTNLDGSSVTVLMNAGNGDGTFASFKRFTTGYFPSSVATGDLNEDGHIDLVVANRYHLGSSVSLLLGNGDGTFGLNTDFPTADSPSSVAIVDLDGNGHLDLAVSTLSDGRLASFLFGVGDGSFGPHVDLPGGDGEVHPCDLNGDGLTDLVIGNYNLNAFSILIAKGGGNYLPRVLVGSGYSPAVLQVGDIQGDDRLDLIAANLGERTISVHIGNGDGTFGINRTIATGIEPDWFATGDLNGDWITDVVVSNLHDSTLSLILGRGDGTFTERSKVPLRAGTGFGVERDVNGDGRLDLLVSETYDDAVAVFLGRGDGTLGGPIRAPVGQYPGSFAVADLNNDHHPDIAALHPYSRFISILFGNGDGSFGARADLPVETWLVSVADGDLNGDGNADLVVASSGIPPDSLASGAPPSIGVFLGTGSGTFQPRLDFASDGIVGMLCLADFNGDKRTDVAFAVQGSSSVSVMMANPDGSLAQPVQFYSGLSPYTIATRDFDGDGHVDLAVSNNARVSVLFGRGDGSFGKKLDVGCGWYARGVAVGDFNRDWRPDLATIGVDGGVILLNRGGAIAIHPAQAFLTTPQRTVALNESGRSLCVQIEPVGEGFDLAEVDPSSIVMIYEEEGSARELDAVPSKGAVTRDSDGDGVEDLSACFTYNDLQKLFPDLRGRRSVQVTVEGGIAASGKFRATVELNLVGTEASLNAFVFPNPFNPVGRFNFVTHRPGFARLRVVDAQGRLVRELLDTPSLAPGAHEVKFDARGETASGIYFYVIEASEGTARGRFTILK